jgi:hypothetical protein
MPKPWIVGAVAFVAGAALASGAWTAFPPSHGRTESKGPTPVIPDPNDVKDLVTANANLTQSLQECDRRLTELGEHPVELPQAPVTGADAGRRERRQRAEMTPEDWERMAEAGTVPVRFPCIRDKPWAPTDRAVDRLGLAPGDVDTIRQAYAASNKRVSDAVTPLCVQTLGNAQLAEKVGPADCIDLIAGAARKSSGGDAKAALTRVAEAQAKGSASVGNDAPLVAQLAVALLKESKAFEDDLAQKFGPEDAKHLVLSPDLCTERKTLRGSDGEAPRDSADAGARPSRRNRNNR